MEDKQLKLAIGFFRWRETAGQRFAWINGKNLTFSCWHKEEPIGGDQHGCCVWKINISPFEDSGWGTEKCGDKNVKPLIICQDGLRLTADNATGLGKTGVYAFGEIYS